MIDYPKYKKVLFCTDFSKISDCAFDYAFGIAKRDEGMLYILHVIPVTPQQYHLERHLTKKQLDEIAVNLETANHTASTAPRRKTGPVTMIRKATTLLCVLTIVISSHCLPSKGRLLRRMRS